MDVRTLPRLYAGQRFYVVTSRTPASRPAGARR